MWIKKALSVVTSNNFKYDQFAKEHQAKTNKEKWFYIFMHLLPGMLALVGYLLVIEPLVKFLGIDYQYAQLIILLFMSVGWEIILTFLMLKKVEKLNFKESLQFLGFTKPSFRTMLVTLLLSITAFLIIMVPFQAYIYPALYDVVDRIPLLHIPNWHLIKTGYYNFPFYILAIAFIGNFIGEEIYFRGYLLKKISTIKGDWVIGAILFQLYHFWQAPINWPYLLIAPVAPFTLLTKLNKNIYPAIIFHLLADLVLFDVIAHVINLLPLI